jgi:hypothetical protein
MPVPQDNTTPPVGSGLLKKQKRTKNIYIYDYNSTIW